MKGEQKKTKTLKHEDIPTKAGNTTPIVTSNNVPPPVHFVPNTPTATKSKKKPAVPVPKTAERLLSLWVDQNFDWRNISLDIQEPELHQIVMSWLWYPSPLEALMEVFGEPSKTRSKKTGEVVGYKFSNGLYLRKKPAKNTLWYTIRFNAEKDILTGLASIAKTLSPLWKGVLRVQIKKAEVVWNIPFPDKSYWEIEQIMRAMLAVAVPKEQNTVLIIKRDKKDSGPDKKKKGKITAYFKKVWKNKAGELVYVKEQPHEIKIYLKKIMDVWNIRIELTFSKEHLKPYIVLPNCIRPRWIDKFPLDKYLVFAKIKRKKFAKEIWKRLHPKKAVQKDKRYKTVHPDYALWTTTRSLPAAEQKYMMYTLAKSVAERVQRKLSSGEFENEMELFEE